MNNCLRIPLVAEAVVLDALCNFDCISFRKTSDKSLWLKLDLILSTATNFADAFSEMFDEIFTNHCLMEVPEEGFIKFVIPRGLILSQKKTYFNLMLVCGFISEIVYYFNKLYNCFHFAKLAWKCLLQIMKSEFEDLLEMDNGWQGLLSFCEEMNSLVTNYSVEKSFSHNSLVNIKTNILDSPNEDLLIKNLNSLNIVDSETNTIDDCRLQTKSSGSLVDSDSLDKNIKRNIIQDADIIGVVDFPRSSSLFKDTESTYRTRCDKSKKFEYLYELLTDSSEHLNEILDLIDSCNCDDNSNTISLIDYDDLYSDEPKTSVMVEKVMPTSEGDIFICKCIASKSIGRNEKELVCLKENETRNSFPTNMSKGDLPKFPSDSLDDKHFGCLSSNASDASNSKCLPTTALDDNQSANPSMEVLEEEFIPCQCCELCKGKEDKYLLNWEKDFLERYSELQ